jgi:hypothetical protein
VLQAWRAGPTKRHGLFFIGGGRRQIGGINDGDGLTARRQERQELFDQVFIDGAQRRHPGTGAKLMQHPDIRGALPMRQPRKVPPSTLLRQQTDHGIKTVRRGQQGQQVYPPKLGGAEKMTRSWLRASGHERVDKWIRNKCRKRFQQFSRAGGW